MNDDPNTAVLEETIVRTTKPEPDKKRDRADADRDRPKRQPRYNVILWDDDDHTYEYVITMLNAIFAYPPERGIQLAVEVDKSGRAILLTTTKEHAELKRDQIHAFGRDPMIKQCAGSMTATIEPVPGE